MINISKLAFSYGKNEVLSNITMNLEKGKIYGLLGENGVGKTTLLTLLCGLKKAQIGSILIDNQEPIRREPSLLSKIYYLPDEVAPIHQKALCWAKETGIFWPKFSLDTFKEILSIFEVKQDQKMHTMSAGQLKKTHIAFALACNCDYIFMDEPTNGLDIPSKAQFRSAVMKYTAEDSVVIISTHQVRDLENVIDPIIILDRCDVLLNASLEEISEKLYFDYENSLATDSLYTEALPGGLIQVRPNTEHHDSKVNIEALFNAVHNNKETIKRLF